MRPALKFSASALLVTLCSAALAQTTPSAVPAPSATPSASADPLTTDIPAAVITDPPPDKDHPSHFIAFNLLTHGANVHAMMYVPGGPGPFPTVILFHGFPGHENNTDLGQAMRRAGWNVMFVRMRGSWGSPGHFTFRHCLEDAQAAVAWLRNPKTVAAQPVDPKRIVLIGRSLGGWIAGYTAAHDPGIMGTALISAGDWSGRAVLSPRKSIVALMQANIDVNVTGDATAESLTDDFFRVGKDWDLTQFAPQLARRPLLILSANDDGMTDYNGRISKAVEAQSGAKVTLIHFDTTDQGYNDHRIALAGVLVNWLDSLPGAPK